MGLSSVTTSNPRPCKGAILGVQFNADIAAVKAFRCKPGGAASKKRVKDNAACRTARQYARFRELRGIGGKMPALYGTVLMSQTSLLFRVVGIKASS